MISGVHHLAIQVRDLAVCERFYREVLGLSVLRRWPAQTGDGAEDRSVWLDLGAGAFLALEVSTPQASRDDSGAPAKAARSEGPGLFFFALGIGRGERSIWEQRLGAAGVTIVHRTAYTLYFHDPEGNRLGLSHYPEAQPTIPDQAS
jgi:glyoxylase I family protein